MPGSLNIEHGRCNSYDALQEGVNDVRSFIKSPSPIRRSWFDVTTANSLERGSRSRKRCLMMQKSSNESTPIRSYSTIPRRIKPAHLLSSTGRDSPALSNLSAHTISDFRLSSSNCENINLALNNSLPLNYVNPIKSPIETNSSSGVSSTTSSHDERSFFFYDKCSPKKKVVDFTRRNLTTPGKAPARWFTERDNDDTDCKTSNKDNMRAKSLRNEDLDSLTRRLVHAMTELKDIVGVTRIIDEVDDEEWLLVFIGELEIHLKDLMRIQTRRNSFSRQEELVKKETLLKVVLELLDYLKSRSIRVRHRSCSKEISESTDLADKADTLNRLKALASEKPLDFSSMNRWQRKLAGLARVLDKYLQRLTPKLSDSTLNVQEEDGQSKESGRVATKVATEADSNKPCNGLSSKPVISLENQFKQNDKKRRSSQPKQSLKHQKCKNLRAVNDSTATKEPSSFAKSTTHTSQSVNTFNLNLAGKEKDKSKTSLTKSNFYPCETKDSKFLEARERFQNGNFSTHQTHPKSFKNQTQIVVKQDLAKEKMSQTSLEMVSSDVISKSSKLVEDTKVCQVLGGSLDRKLWRKERETRRLKYRSSSCHEINKVESLDNNVHFSFFHHLHAKEEVFDTNEMTFNEVRKTPKESKGINQVAHISIEVTNDHDNQAKPMLFCEKRTEPVVEAVTTETTHLHPDVIEVTCESAESQLSKWNDTVDSPYNVTESASAESSSATGYFPLPSPKPRFKTSASVAVSTSSSTQCNIISEEGVRKADDEINRLKKSAELLRRGITEAREERDDKDRRIAILESRVQRLKKTMEDGRSAKESFQEQLEKIRIKLQTERRENSEEVSELQKRIDDRDEKIQQQSQRVDDLEQWIKKLKEETKETNEKYNNLIKEKRQLEGELHNATLALLKEKRLNRRLQAENIKLELEISKAKSLKAKEKREALTRKKKEREMEVSDLLHEAVTLVSMQKQANNETNSKADIEEAKQKIESLKEENQTLVQQNDELRHQLMKEQDVSVAATDCFRQQVEYLTNEVSVYQESAKAQKDQYEYEIDRLLSSRTTTENTQEQPTFPTFVEDIYEAQFTSLQSQVVSEETVTKTLQLENKKLRKERDDLKKLVSERSSSKEVETQDFACQMDDMSYTRMRAYDFYSQEALRNARRLAERGRNFPQEIRPHLVNTRKLEVDIIKRENLLR